MTGQEVAQVLADALPYVAGFWLRCSRGRCLLERARWLSATLAARPVDLVVSRHEWYPFGLEPGEDRVCLRIPRDLLPRRGLDLTLQWLARPGDPFEEVVWAVGDAHHLRAYRANAALERALDRPRLVHWLWAWLERVARAWAEARLPPAMRTALLADIADAKLAARRRLLT